MEATTQLSDVVKLGKRLVTELDGDENRDTLSHWMAHHIADLIQRLEAQGTGDRLELEAECRRAILELWAHRGSFRSSSRPFAELEPLLSTLRSLDPNSTSHFYFRELSDHIGKNNAPDEPAGQWLNLARSIDRGARTLIGYCISRAAAEATDDSADWVELARKVESKLDNDVELVRIIINNASLLKDIVPADERSVAKSHLQKRVESLDNLAVASAELRGQLVDQIRRLDTGEDPEAVSR